MIIRAEDVRCGYVLSFRGEMYVCLSSFTGQRHTQTILTCVRHAKHLRCDEEVIILRLLRRFEVNIRERLVIHISVLENPAEDARTITSQPETA